MALRARRRNGFWRPAATVAALLAAARLAGAAGFSWDNAAGDSLWNLTSLDWAGVSGDVAWPNDYSGGTGTTDLAGFSGAPTPGPVLVTSNILLTELTFTADGWTLADGGGSLAVPDSGSPGNVLVILGPMLGSTATIDAAIKDNDGAITGATAKTTLIIGAGGVLGNVVLGGNNSYSGTTTLLTSAFTGNSTALRGATVVTANNALGTAAAGTVVGNASFPGVLAFSGGVQYTTAEAVTLTTGNTLTGAIRSTDGNNLFAGTIAITASGNNFFGVDAGSSLSLSGQVSGAGTLWKVGGGTLALYGNDSSLTGQMFIGMIGNGAAGTPSIINPAGSVSLGSGPLGVGMIHSGTVEVSWTGSLVIDSSGKSSSANTIRGTGALILENGGGLTVLGSLGSDTSDSFNGALFVGPLFSGVGSGDAPLVITPAGHVTLVKFASLQRNTSISYSSGTVTFTGPNFGNPGSPVGTPGVAQVMFASAPVLTANAGSTGILPYGVVVDTATGATALATYDAVTGIRGLAGADYGSGGPVAGALVQGNNLITASKALSGGSAQVNSVTLRGSNITVSGTGNYAPGTGTSTLTLVGGAVVGSGSGNVLNFSNLATIQSDFFFNVTGDLTVGSALIGSNTGLQKTGPGELILTGTSSFATTTSTHLDPIKVSGGTLTFGAAANLGASGNFIDLYNGTLHATGGTAGTPRTIDLTAFTITAGAGTTNGGLDAAAIKIGVDPYTTLKIMTVNSSITLGQSGYTKVGPGTLYLTGGDSNTSLNGTSYLAEGTLAFNAGGVQALGGLLVASPGTTIWFDSASSGASPLTHLGDVQMTGGAFNVTGNNSGGTTDRVHSVTLGPGASSVNITQGTGGGGRTTVLSTTAGITRQPGATVVYPGAGLGTLAAGVAQVKYTTLPTLIGGNGGAGGILPWALTDTTVGGNGVALATYSNNGITANTATTAGISFGNALVTANDAGSGTINSLTISGSGISAGSGALAITSGGILNLGGSNTIAATSIALGSAEGIVHALGDLSITGHIGGSAGLTKAGAGTLTLAAQNSYTGPATWINAGTISVANDNALGDASVPVIFNSNPGGTGLAFTGNTSSTRGLTISDSAAATISVSGGSAVTLNGAIVGPGSLQKTGPGTLNLTGTNAYAGATTISAGTLLVNSVSATGAGPVMLNAGTLGGYGSIAGILTLGGAPHTIAPSATLGVGSHGTLTLGALATNANTTLAFNLVTPGSASVSDRINVTGYNGLTLGGGKLVIANHSTGSASLGYYKIMAYSGAIGGSGIAGLTPPVDDPATHVAYRLYTNHELGFIDLHRGLLGDANDDGITNFSDFVLLSNNFGQANKGWGGGDFNNDGITNFSDFVTLSNNFGQTIGSNEVAMAGVDAIGTPEPSSLLVLGMGALALWRSRRGRRRPRAAE